MSGIRIITVIAFVMGISLTDAVDPPTSRRLPITMLGRRRQMLGLASEPIMIRISPGSRPTGRRVPSNMASNSSESSVLRLKPVIRFHVPTSNEASNETKAEEQELYDVMNQMGLHRMASLLQGTSLGQELVKLGPITLFAPTDEAFSLAPRGLIDNLQSGPVENLRNLLLYHAIRGHMHPEDARNDFTMPSLHTSSTPLRFNIYNDGQVVSVAGGQFLGSWKQAGDVLIQPVDRVLYPLPTTDIVQKTRQQFSDVYVFLLKAGLTDQLSSGTFTIFNPTNDAFSVLPSKAMQLLETNSTLLRKFLLNHIVPGTYFSTAFNDDFQLKSLGGSPLIFSTRRGLILVNGIPIVNADLPVTNGVVHALNRVVVPDELIEQCRCMVKYPMAPATLRPAAQQWNPQTEHPPGTEPPFGARLNGPQNNDHNVDNDQTTPGSESPVQIRPPLVHLLSRSMTLPDGRILTFDKAGQLFRRSILFSKLRQPGRRGFTILMPTDEAFHQLPMNVMDRLERDPLRLARVLRWHIVEGTINPSDLENNSRLKTLGGGTLLVNVLPRGKNLPTIVIGGIQVLASRRANNGAVFAVDRVFEPPPMNTDISGGANPSPNRADPDQLTIWRKLIDDVPDLKQELKSRSQVYTMFAPVDSAFSEFNSDQMQRLLNEESLKRDIIRSHVLLGAYYRRMFISQPTIPTLLGNKLSFLVIPDGFTVNDVPVTKPPIVTSNGVVYIVTKILVSPEPTDMKSTPARSAGPVDTSNEPFSPYLQEIARLHNATTFLKWIHASGLRDAIRPDTYCTLFLPTNDGIATMSPTLRLATLQNPKALKKLVQYHICPYPIRSIDDMAHEDLLLPSLLPKKLIRCNVYKNNTVVTASGCPVSEVVALNDERLSVVVVKKPLASPVGDTFLTMSKSPMLRNFSKIVKVSQIEKDLPKGQSYTFFAPSKCAFSKMDPSEYQKLITDPEAAREFVLRHLVRGCIYTSGIADGMTVTSLSGKELRFATVPTDCIRVNGVKMKYGDLGATNGVIHVVADIL